jgi:tRNA synthetases class I (I, L, M and V)
VNESIKLFSSTYLCNYAVLYAYPPLICVFLTLAHTHTHTPSLFPPPSLILVVFIYRPPYFSFFSLSFESLFVLSLLTTPPLNSFSPPSFYFSFITLNLAPSLSFQAYPHKYPYDWRTKKPTIFRATEQWFASVGTFRSDALEAIEKVRV